MKRKLATLLIFVGNLVIFIISVNLFYQMGIYVDEHNTSASVVCGGDFWLMADWLRLVLSGFMTILSGGMLLRSGKK
ncbi:MAG: hypothetical protein HFI52_09900 [Lachnospiraceae bacterium]|nr:hypothetical protein [Lachnospiraceae bacterium]